MTTRALLTADDARRLTQAANESGCMIEVKRGDTTITITPNGYTGDADETNHVEKVDLDRWRVKPRQGGKRNAKGR